MKRLLVIFLALALLLGSCAAPASTSGQPSIAATTWPVYCFASALCDGTGLQVTQVISEPVSCLHDYTLSIRQMQDIERADVVICSGGGLEDFMADALAQAKAQIDASEGISLLPGEDGDDPHIWLSPKNAGKMVENIAQALTVRYPERAEKILANRDAYLAELSALQAYGDEQLANLSTRELITFHDGFAYFAAAFNLTILAAIEEESGSEASAAELRDITALVQSHKLPAVFVEENGSAAAAFVIAQETGCKIYTLSMAMGETDYLQAMRNNIDTIREALS